MSERRLTFWEKVKGFWHLFLIAIGVRKGEQ